MAPTTQQSTYGPSRGDPAERFSRRALQSSRTAGRASRKTAPANGNQFWNEARRYLVGGVDSPVRAFRHVGAEPLALVQASGAAVIDATGHRFIDFIMGWGALILGHQAPAVLTAARKALEESAVLGLTHPAEIELARIIVDAVPSVEQVRFTVSGTEACMTAIRLARALTGRTRILTTEGGYHGHSDAVLAYVSAGIPKAVSEATFTVPFNDIDQFDAVLARDGDHIACVILEPIPANMGVIVPQSGYLEHVRQQCTARGILLIFDEVVTGFRVGLGGAQESIGVKPDLTTFGKIIGGGFPIGAVGGPRQLMQRLAPQGDVYHGGTFAGHPLSMAAGVATLRQLRTRLPYRRLNELAQRLANGLRLLACKQGVPVQVNQVGSMMTVFFSQSPVCRLAQAKAADCHRFAQWVQAARSAGMLLPPSPLEAVFLSVAHTRQQIDRLLDSSARALATMAKNR